MCLQVGNLTLSQQRQVMDRKTQLGKQSAGKMIPTHDFISVRESAMPAMVADEPSSKMNQGWRQSYA